MWQNTSMIIERLSILIRVAFKNGEYSEWSKWLGLPVDGYAELEATGPFLIRDVVLVEVNPIERKYLGRLLPDREIDHSIELREALKNKKIKFTESEGLFLIVPSTYPNK